MVRCTTTKDEKLDTSMSRTVKSIALLLYLFSCLWIAGCTTPSQPTASPTPRTIEVLDRTHVLAVQSSLQQDAELASANITVNAKGDTLILEGVVQTPEAKTHAEEIARRTKGIEKVENKLEVSSSATP